MRAGSLLLVLLLTAACPGASAPSMTVPSVVTVSEDSALTYITITGISLGSDGVPFLAGYSGDGAKLRMDGAEFIAGSPGSAWVKVQPLPDATGGAWVFLQLFDLTSGTSAPVLISSFLVSITPVNDPPLLYATSALRPARGARIEVTAANLTVEDVDDSVLTLTLVQAPTAGDLLLDQTMLADGATFTPADIAGHRLTYRHRGGPGDADAFAVTVRDSGSLVGPGAAVTVGPLTVGVAVAGGGSPPFVGLPGPPSAYLERGGPAPVMAVAVVEDPDGVAFDRGWIQVAVVEKVHPLDVLDVADLGSGSGMIGRRGSTVTFAGVDIGVVSPGLGTAPLRVQLAGAGATPAAVQALLRAVTFSNVSPDPGYNDRTGEVIVNDGTDGNSVPVRFTWTIISRDDLPELPAGLRLATLPGLTRDLLLGAVDPDRNSNRPIWTVKTQPANALVTMLDGEAQGGPKVRINPTLPGIGSLELQVLDGRGSLSWTTVPVVVATLDEPRPHPAADPPRTVVAGEAVDVVVPWDLRDLDPGAALTFSTTGSAPTGLVLTAQGGDRVRVTWPVPASTKVGTRYRFQVVAEDPVRGIPGFLPVDVLVTPRPAGSG
jgi:hypothetical protein